MKPIRLSEADVCAALDSPLSGSIITLPHGAGRLRIERLTLAPGVSVCVRRGFLKEPFALNGQDCDGFELAFQLGSVRSVFLQGALVLEHAEPILTVYRGRGDHQFEVIEQPTRDATFIEFSFEPDALRNLSIELEQTLHGLLEGGKSFGSTRMVVQPIPHMLSQVARRLVLSSANGPLGLTLRRDAFDLLHLVATERLGAQPNDNSAIAIRAGELIRSNLANPPSVTDLARIADVTASRFLDMFRNQYGVSPSKFVRVERMHRAKERLQNAPAEVTVNQLAWELGYRSTSHFVQAFRHEHGVTPAAFARNAQDV